jgi:hypothetical protein
LTTPVNERLIEEWRCLCPRDVDTEVAFYTQKKAEKTARRLRRAENRRRKAFIEAQLKGPSTIDENDDSVCNKI